jgi:predicted amidohydrolase
MKVAACQMPDLRDAELALSTVHAYALRAQRAGARLVAFPECYLQGYELHAGHVTATAIDLASARFEALLHRLADVEPVIVLGVIEQDAGTFYNMAVAIERGRLLTTYRKRHLLDAEQRVFEAGRTFPVFEVDGVRVGMSICFDLQWPDTSELAAKTRTQLLVCPCNNMLRRENAEKWKARHNAIRAERAQEAGVWLLSSDVTGEREGRISYGPTALIDPTGEVVAQAPLCSEELLLADIVC